MKIYDDYGDEPKDAFIPLSDDLAGHFYDLEMESYCEDGLFYNSILGENASILELGCGSGRIGRHLQGKGRHITGIDISPSMLQKAKSSAVGLPGLQFLAMDMTALGFSCLFDAIVIPYNALNLLVTQNAIRKCLAGCHTYLKPDGVLIAQLFIPTEKFIREGKKTFQFQIFDLPAGGRLIKEILKEYNPTRQTISIEERFRLRPQKPHVQEDYNTTYTVAGFAPEKWLQLIEHSGFIVQNSLRNFQGAPFDSSDSPRLITVCQKKL